MIKFVQKQSLPVNEGEELFSEYEKDHYEEILMEGIKTYDFWNSFGDPGVSGGKDTPHWINIMSDGILKSKDFKNFPQWFFFPLEKNRENIKRLPKGFNERLLLNLEVFLRKK